ncbi:MAG: GNAT family N-acetyltransferase [Acidiferrobacterales bacterium]|nr:GNAT family N-acetyltransferase [Acidiferrobacterales bacterium]
MHIEVVEQLSEIDAHQWNALVEDNNPFLRHEFLHGLELSDCVCLQTGWQPNHIVAYSKDKSALIAAMPCYIKDHSYGEYIFDWSWVNAYHRHGIDYYPKLSNAVPFTPATGPRVLLSKQIGPLKLNEDKILDALIQRAVMLTEEKNLSSFHSLFNSQHQAEKLQGLGLLKRHSTQFHWQNRNYQDFDDFLAGMSSKKRKNIKRERRRVSETGIEYRWLSGEELKPDTVQKMYNFYSRTISYYGAQSYLNRAFFEHLAMHFSDQTLFLFAEFGGETIAGGLYFKSDNTLYGRYWGALANFHSVHFETCYYQAIEWCIKHGFHRFEAGAQGEHKLARGLEPTTTYSSHWISHPEFRQAIADFLSSEETHIGQYQDALQQHSPFKTVEI